MKMDWYKILEIATPSIVTGGTIVFGAYFGYFRKKFATYGYIEAKFEKIPKLSEIERSIANAKNSSEFEYHIQKEKLIHFAALVKKIRSMDSFLMNYCSNMHTNANGFACKSNEYPEYFTYENYKKDMYQSDDFFERFDEIELDFIMYIEVLDDEDFNNSFCNWLKETDQLHRQVLKYNEMIYKIMIDYEYKNKLSPNEAINKIDKLAMEFNVSCGKSKVFSELRKTLFKQCGSLSRTMEERHRA